jgi:hypothetical protein
VHNLSGRLNVVSFSVQISNFPDTGCVRSYEAIVYRVMKFFFKKILLVYSV